MWTDFIYNPRPILNLYQYDIPTLNKVKIEHITLYDGHELMLTINLNKLPNPIPNRWREREYNKSLVKLGFFHINEFELSGWNYDSFVEINFSKENKTMFMEVNAEDYFIKCYFDQHISLRRIFGSK
ncbi:Imm50 family immunity protein [Salinithrix halophila]|uniref:Imm50 family immunity protein n=1 Tax=Salinithrix halophila TaxID=1485204 RepID=A0ABV8JEJ2_9BACL